VKVPFTWKVTGWFMIGWSAGFSASEVHEPQWEVPDLFHKFLQFDTDPDAYVEHPALSKVDAKPCMAMRKPATQFYAVPASV
jgi:hypothetical protein